MNIRNGQILVNKLRQSGIGRIPFVTIAVMALLFPAGPSAASSKTIPVRVTFVDTIAISKDNDLQLGSANQNLANLESVTVVTDPADSVEGGPQVAASLSVTTSPWKPITILVDAIRLGPGHALATFICKYGAGKETACDGASYSETTVESATLLVGVTLARNGTSVPGMANGSFNVTVVYQ